MGFLKGNHGEAQKEPDDPVTPADAQLPKDDLA